MLPQKNNSITVITSVAPYASLIPMEAINFGFAAAAFDQEVTLLFITDGVFQLCFKQNATRLYQKTMGKVLGAAPMYGIEKIYACKHSLKERGLEKEDLILSPTLLEAEEIHEVISGSDTLLSF
jgi:tRNA 2-thiouridine synthesizing protein C